MASRIERLLALIQALRRHRQPVTARQLATELAVSIRTVYRDIETLVAQGASTAGEDVREERKLRIAYLSPDDQQTVRVIWPVAVAFFERVRVVVAWCELRQAFRHFRTDRIASAELTGERMPRRRRELLTEWREAERIAEAERAGLLTESDTGR
jgi:predicted DNA-binding transcriptional regulator YafY